LVLSLLFSALAGDCGKSAPLCFALSLHLIPPHDFLEQVMHRIAPSCFLRIMIRFNRLVSFILLLLSLLSLLSLPLIFVSSTSLRRSSSASSSNRLHSLQPVRVSSSTIPPKREKKWLKVANESQKKTKSIIPLGCMIILERLDNSTYENCAYAKGIDSGWIVLISLSLLLHAVRSLAAVKSIPLLLLSHHGPLLPARLLRLSFFLLLLLLFHLFLFLLMIMVMMIE